MSRAASVFGNIATGLDRCISFIAIIAALAALVAMFLALLLEVIVRYATNSGLGWPTELPSILFPWLVMGGVVLAAQRGQHIAVTAIVPLLGRNVIRILFVFLQIVLTAVFVYLTDVGLRVIEVTGTEVYPVTGMSAKWAYLALLAGFTGIAITAVSTIIRLIIVGDPLTVRTHDPEADI